MGWKNKKFVEEKVHFYHFGQVHQNMPTEAPLHPWKNATLPWVKVHLDFTWSFMGKMFLILFNSYTE